MRSREELPTERPNEATRSLETATITEAFELFQAEDATVLDAVAAARPEIVRAIELVTSALARGGRLLYVGAGTSGRLGVLDAVECPPTFQSDPRAVQGILAGGDLALRRAVEGAEDAAAEGARAMDGRRVGADDVVLGITAGGTTPFVHGALGRARARGAATIFLACVPRSAVPDEADVSIRVVTGPEVLAGSTRLKAGTATKLVLNRITTIAMARLGKVHQNLMIDLQSRGNAKLRERAAALVARLTELPREEACELLERCGGKVKLAVLAQRAEIPADEAERRLQRAGGFLSRALAGGSGGAP